jgi:hypothetical protein
MRCPQCQGTGEVPDEMERALREDTNPDYGRVRFTEDTQSPAPKDGDHVGHLQVGVQE